MIEREAFLNEDIAEFMNENFVCVLIDKEERPAIDNACLRYLMLIKETPSWPLHLFMTPERVPLFGSSYLPNDSDQRNDGQTLLSVLKHVQANWRRNTDGYLLKQSRTDLARAQEVIDQRPVVVGPSTGNEAESPDQNQTAAEARRPFTHGSQDADQLRLVETAARSRSRKFPLVPGLRWLHQYSINFPGEATAEEARQIVETSLTQLAAGGIRDHVGGGFPPLCI